MHPSALKALVIFQETDANIFSVFHIKVWNEKFPNAAKVSNFSFQTVVHIRIEAPVRRYLLSDHLFLKRLKRVTNEFQAICRTTSWRWRSRRRRWRRSARSRSRRPRQTTTSRRRCSADVPTKSLPQRRVCWHTSTLYFFPVLWHSGRGLGHAQEVVGSNHASCFPFFFSHH